MLSHGLVSGALFLCVGVVYDRLHTREIDRYGGLVQQHAGLRPAVHALHHGLGRPARHRAASSASSWPWSAPMRRTAGSPRSRRPASSSAPPTCSASTGGSPSARAATPTPRRCPISTRANWLIARADRRRRAVDGRLSGELHGADARATSASCSPGSTAPGPQGDAQLTAGPSRAGRRRRAARAMRAATAAAPGGAPLMNSDDFLLHPPREILTRRRRWR